MSETAPPTAPAEPHDLTIATQVPIELAVEDDTAPRLITDNQLVGWMAHWAVRQHPYHRPEGLFDIVDCLKEAAQAWPHGISKLPMWRVADWAALERWMRDVLKDHPVLTAWNTPRSGHTQQIVVSSRYGGPEPEHDFIDIDALLRNVALSTWRRADD